MSKIRTHSYLEALQYIHTHNYTIYIVMGNWDADKIVLLKNAIYHIKKKLKYDCIIYSIENKKDYDILQKEIYQFSLLYQKKYIQIDIQSSLNISLVNHIINNIPQDTDISFFLPNSQSLENINILHEKEITILYILSPSERDFTEEYQFIKLYCKKHNVFISQDALDYLANQSVHYNSSIQNCLRIMSIYNDQIFDTKRVKHYLFSQSIVDPQDIVAYLLDKKLIQAIELLNQALEHDLDIISKIMWNLMSYINTSNSRFKKQYNIAKTSSLMSKLIDLDLILKDVIEGDPVRKLVCIFCEIVYSLDV